MDPLFWCNSAETPTLLLVIPCYACWVVCQFSCILGCYTKSSGGVTISYPRHLIRMNPSFTVGFNSIASESSTTGGFNSAASSESSTGGFNSVPELAMPSPETASELSTAESAPELNMPSQHVSTLGEQLDDLHRLVFPSDIKHDVAYTTLRESKLYQDCLMAFKIPVRMRRRRASIRSTPLSGSLLDHAELPRESMLWLSRFAAESVNCTEAIASSVTLDSLFSKILTRQALMTFDQVVRQRPSSQRLLASSYIKGQLTLIQLSRPSILPKDLIYVPSNCEWKR